MNLSESLCAHLKNDAGVSAIVGTKVYPLRAPRDIAFPFVIYQTIGGAPEHCMVSDAGVRGTLVQLSSWAAEHAAALVLAMAVETSLKDFSGTLGGIGGVTVDRIFAETEIVDDLDETAGTEPAHRARQDLRVWYS